MTTADIVRKATQELDKWSVTNGEWRKSKSVEVTIRDQQHLATVRFSTQHQTSGKRYPVSIGGHWQFESCEIKAVMEVDT